MTPMGFLRWWRDQLADWLPARLRHWFTARGNVLQLTPVDDGWQLTLQHGGRRDVLGHTATLDADGLQARLAGQPAPARIDLTLPSGQYLSRTLDLPLAAAADLGQAISYQIDSLTPFKRDQLWLFCGEQQRLPDGKRLRAWLVAVPRRVGSLFDELRLAVSPQPVLGPRQAPAQDAPVTLGFRPAARAGTLPLGWLLVLLNLLALMLAVSLHLDNREAELTALKQQARDLQAEAVAASDLDRQVQLLQGRLDKLQARHTAYLPRVAVLDELTRRLDDQTWVHRLELRQQQLRLQGSSTNASALIGQLDASPLLGEVRFEASLTRDPAGGERFNLTGQLTAPAEERTEAPAVAETRP